MADNTTNIGFEKQIWDAACVLRGNLDASEYKSVVLGLIFLKYISDRFDEKHQQLVDEGDGFEEDVDEYISEGIFFVPETARWNAIKSHAHTPEIGTVIDDAMRAIEKENKRLKDVLPKNFARPELDKRRLGDIVDLFTNIKMVDEGSSRDVLGRTYEYCLSKFAEQEGKLAGEFYTPPVWCVRWSKYYSPTMAACMIPAADRVACLYRAQNLLRIIVEILIISLCSVRILTRPHGNWHR